MGMQNCIKKWSDFTSSEMKPLFWVLIGPLLIVLTLLVSLPIIYDPLLPCLAFLGLLLICKYRLAALFTLLFLSVCYLLTQSFLSVERLEIGKSLSFFSCNLSLFIFFLSIEEVETFYTRRKKRGEQSISKLEGALRRLDEKGVLEKKLMQAQLERMEKEIFNAQGEIKTLLQLVNASQLESEKIHQQNQGLAKESLEQHRQIERFKLQKESFHKEFGCLKEMCKQLTQDGKIRLKQLNTARTDCMQMHLLLEAAEKELKTVRSRFSTPLAQFQDQTQTVLIPLLEEKILKAETEECDSLKRLERDKAVKKEAYMQMQKEYQKLGRKLKKAKANERGLIQKSNDQLLVNLGRVKSELTFLEREIFVLKKKMQQEGVGVF